MKKLFLISCMACLWHAMFAANTLTIASASGSPGNEVEITLQLDNDDAATAIETHIALDSNLTYVDGSCQLNEVRSDGHSLVAAVVDGELRIYAYSLAQHPFKGNSGKLFSLRLRLGYQPGTYKLTPTVLLSNAAGEALPLDTDTGEVVIVAPKLTLVTPNIDYGLVPICNTHHASLTLQNSGNLPLQITEITSDSEWLTAEEDTFTIEAGETHHIEVLFSPTQRGKFTSNIYITSNAVNGIQTATVTAEPFSVNELHLSSASGISDGTVTLTFSIQNMEPIVAMQCDVKLPEVITYVEGSATLLNLSIDHHVETTIHNGVLQIFVYSPYNTAFAGNEGDLLSIELRLDGRSGTYSIEPYNVILSNIAMENMISATSGGTVEIKSPQLSSNDTIDFGNQPITDDVTTEYEVHNIGYAPLNIEQAVFLSEGYEMCTPLPLNIPAGASDTLQVRYNPQVAGEFSTTMQLYSNDPELRMKNVAIYGTVIEPNSLQIEVTTTDNGDCLVTISMENYTEIVALQLDLYGLINTSEEKTELTVTERLAAHNAVLSQMGDGSYRVVIYSLSNEAVKGNSGALFTIAFSPTTSTSTTVTLDNVVMSNINGINMSTHTTITVPVEYGTPYYTLTVGDAEHGIVEATPGRYKAGTVLSLHAIADEGYRFVTWSNGVTENPLELTLSADTTLTPKFEAELYTVVYIIDNDTVACQSVAYGSNIPPINDPIKEGYSFVGWSEIPETMPAHDVVIYGSFKINEYCVIYYLDDEEYYHEYVIYGTPVYFIDDPIKEGMIFGGWISSIHEGDPMPAHDIEVNGSFISSIEALYTDKETRYTIYDIKGILINLNADINDLYNLARGIYIINGKKVLIGTLH